MNTNYASFGQRLVAVIIDVIIIGVAQSFIIVLELTQKPNLSLLHFNTCRQKSGQFAFGFNPGRIG